MAQRAGRLVLPALCLLFALLFGRLGLWQVDRLHWKRELIARVDQRLAAPPIAIPPRNSWRSINAKDIEYRRAWASGTYLHKSETLVQALTERGAGFWVMTPLRTGDGILLVNRGFVPADRADPTTRRDGQVEGPVKIEGLLRSSEPGGRLLRANRPAENRWYSRDVMEIATAHQVAPVAPFFLDAGAAPNPGGLPIGGLTVVRFRNTHLIYALTWFGLTGFSLFGLALTMTGVRRER